MSRDKSHTRVLTVVRWPVGGVRTHILYTYASLAQAGYNFTFVVPDHVSSDPFRIDVQQWKGSESFGAPATDRKCSFRPTVRRLLRQRRFDVVHVHGLTAAAPVVFANVGCGVPVVVTSHGMFSEDDRRGITGKIKVLTLERVLKRVHTIIAVSNDARENHLEYLPRLKKGPCQVVVMHNGIDLGRIECADEEANPPLRDRLRLNGNTYLMGFAGRFEREKGFLYLVDAMDKLLAEQPGRQLHLICIGRDECPARMRPELARRPRVANCITFLGHVPNIAPILKALDLVVMPSVSEAWGLVAAEAMCVGTPVLGTNCAGLREVLSGTPSRTVPPGDTSALARAIEDAMDASLLLKEQARQYAPNACARFDVCRCSRQLASLFDQLTRRVVSAT